MNLKEFQKSVERTMNTTEDYRDEITDYALGLIGEAGEVSEHIKKFRFHEHHLNVEEIGEELGDVLWYLTAIAKRVGYSLNEIMQINADKLSKRYPSGFNKNDSQNRVE